MEKSRGGAFSGLRRRETESGFLARSVKLYEGRDYTRCPKLSVLCERRDDEVLFTIVQHCWPAVSGPERDRYTHSPVVAAVPMERVYVLCLAISMRAIHGEPIFLCLFSGAIVRPRLCRTAVLAWPTYDRYLQFVAK